MHISHQQVAITDPGLTPVLNGATMDRTVLADNIVITNDQRGQLTSVFLVLAFFADTGELEIRLLRPITVGPLITT